MPGACGARAPAGGNTNSSATPDAISKRHMSAHRTRGPSYRLSAVASTWFGAVRRLGIRSEACKVFREVVMVEVSGGEGGIRAESRRAGEPRGSLKSARAAIERAKGEQDGGEGGIRTHVPLRTRRFRGAPVTTTSVPLRVTEPLTVAATFDYSSRVALRTGPRSTGLAGG